MQTRDQVDPRTLQELLSLSADELARCDIARMNLLCAVGLPGATNLDVDEHLAILDTWAETLGLLTESNRILFDEEPAAFQNSLHRFVKNSMPPTRAPFQNPVGQPLDVPPCHPLEAWRGLPRGRVLTGLPNGLLPNDRFGLPPIPPLPSPRPQSVRAPTMTAPVIVFDPFMPQVFSTDAISQVRRG